MFALLKENIGFYCTYECGTYYKVHAAYVFYLFLKTTLGYIALVSVPPKLQPNLFVSYNIIPIQNNIHLMSDPEENSYF